MTHTEDPNQEALFTIKGLKKTYRMGEVKVEALRGVDLTVFKGEFIVILGPSGSGKSTLINILGGLDGASQGQVHFGDTNLTQFNASQLTQYRRHSVGFVFQFYNLIPSLTARENVALVSDISPNAMSPEDALCLVNLGDRLDHFPSQLSGGEQQRVAIARALAKRPGILFCDEPTGALDRKTGIAVMEVLDKVNQELGSTVAVVTHNAIIAEMAHRVLFMADGDVEKIHVNAQRLAPHLLSW